MNHFFDDTALVKERLFKLFHVIITLIIFYAFWLLFRYDEMFPEYTRSYRYNFYVTAGYLAIYLFFGRTYSAYLLGYSRIRGLVFAQFVSQCFSVAIVYALVSIAWLQLKSPLWLLAMLPVMLVVDAAWSYHANGLFYKLNPTKDTILLYMNNTDVRRVKSVNGKPLERLYRIVEECCCDGMNSREVLETIKGYDAVVVSGLDSRIRNAVTKYCLENSVQAFVLPHVGDVIMHGAEHIKTFSLPVLSTTRKKNKPEYLFVKRAFDIFASLCGIVILSPLMGITALAIKAYDHGPALYKQTRLTKDGKEFKILKFRSMRLDAEKDGVARLSTGENDPRITPIGRFVRKCRLDELPQLFNILKGDMTIVGPRPERPEIAEQYYEFLPEFKLRLQVKAGLTGYAQIYGRYNTEPYEKLEFDLMYINTMNVLTDIRLMFATFGVLFSSESTEGVAEGQMTAMSVDNMVGQGFTK